MTAMSDRLPSIPHREDARTLVMGVLNVTPDSFSDGGEYHEQDAAIARGMELVSQGADIVDVGGESTRPGATRVSTDEEITRTIAVVAGLRNRITASADQDVTISIDTMRSVVARRAIEAGARLVNDVSGGLADSKMFTTVAELQVPIVIMHWRVHSQQMNEFTHYGNVVREVRDHLANRVEAALASGIAESRIILDPGLGFAKEAHHNWELLGNLDRLLELGFPVLLGASRKRFLRAAVTQPGQELRPMAELAAATDAVSALAAQAGVWAVRVHDVPGSVDAVTVAANLRNVEQQF